MITAAAALEEGVVSLEDRFHCPGYIVVEDRRIRCHFFVESSSHGAAAPGRVAGASPVIRHAAVSA